MIMKPINFLFLSLILFLFAFSFAQIPQTMSYQGMLTNSEGQIVNDDTYSMTFKIYDQVTDGNLLWEEGQNVDILNGIFDVTLGESNPLNINFNQSYWLGITIAGGDELAPRIELTASPYSLNAQQVLGTNIFPADGNVGIGTSDPEYQVEVKNNVTITGSGIEGGQMTLLDADRQGGWEMDNYGESGNEEIRIFRGKGFNDQFSVLHIKSNGNVGIATSNPEHKLEVNGTISSIDGGFKFPDGSVQTTAAGGSGGDGDITSVHAGNGLTGGATTGDATLDVGTGTGISVTADAVTLNTTYTDGRYVNEGQGNSISADMITPNVLSSVDGVSNDGGNIDLVAGSNVTITPNDANNTITISSSGGAGGGDITAVTAGAGLTGGGATADVNLDVGAGTGITVSADAVALNTTYTDGRYVNEGQGSSITAGMITPDVLSSLDGVSNDGGNIDLVAGDNVTITPNDGTNTITIAASAGAGDNLGNHTATQNVNLNGNWLSGDGENEGIWITDNGRIGIGEDSPTMSLDVYGRIRATCTSAGSENGAVWGSHPNGYYGYLGGFQWGVVGGERSSW
jgi:hypothetical protein